MSIKNISLLTIWGISKLMISVSLLLLPKVIIGPPFSIILFFIFLTYLLRIKTTVTNMTTRNIGQPKTSAKQRNPHSLAATDGYFCFGSSNNSVVFVGAITLLLIVVVEVVDVVSKGGTPQIHLSCSSHEQTIGLD